MISFAKMRSVHVDPSTKRALCDPGVPMAPLSPARALLIGSDLAAPPHSVVQAASSPMWTWRPICTAWSSLVSDVPFSFFVSTRQ